MCGAKHIPHLFRSGQVRLFLELSWIRGQVKHATLAVQERAQRRAMVQPHR